MPEDQSLSLLHRLLPAALDRVDEAVYCTDAAGQIVFVNAGFCRLFGGDPASLVGRPARDIAPLGPEAEGRRGEAEVRHTTRDGRTLVVGLSWMTLEDEGGRIIGAAHVAHDVTERRRREEALRRAMEEVAAQQAALGELAIRDELTGLYNRKEMVRLLREEIERCRRYRRPLSLVLMDVDQLREVRGRHGDLAGDEVLRQLATVLQNNLRPVDRPARFGAQELALVLPDTYGPDAVQVAERIRSLTADAAFQVVSKTSQRVAVAVTVSIGVAGLQDVEESPDELLRAANAALLESQRRGRNRTVAYSDLAIPRAK